jgi:dipeptidyl aminopeptidase/acylaminoacyl peptidase
MYKSWRAVGAIVFALASISASAAFSAPPVEAFGSLPGAELARLSPDGKHLAVIKPVNGREKIVFLDLTKPNSTPYVVGMEGALASDVYWKSNDRAICIFHANLTPKWTKGVSSWARAISVVPSTQTAVLLMSNAPYFRANYDEGSIADMDAGDPDHVYMTEVDRWDVDYTLDLYRVDLATGFAEMVLRGNSSTIRFIGDGYGHVVGQIEQSSDLVDHVMVGANEVYKYDVRGGTAFEIEGLTIGNNPQVAAERPTASGTTGLYSWGGPGAGAPLFESPYYDIDDVLTDERNGRVIGVTYIDDAPRTAYFDPLLQHVQTTLEKVFPGQTVSILSSDEAGTSFVILTQGPKNPPVLSLYTTADHQVNEIDEAYPSLKPSDLGEMKPYPYKARDGLDIHAYLTLPPGRDPHNLPTVIFPHGGPEDRDSMEFDWWAQFMASRGYAVLQPNFRGSSGYGSNFVRAGDGEWGGKVQTDVQDGVQKLIADGIADPKKICIVGASYGGYMALAGATFSPDLYACAISFAGLSDLNRMLYTGTTFESESVSVWKRRIGADVDDKKMDSQSPAKFADRVKIPVLLIHSDKDTTVPIEQSQIEERALKSAGKQVEFVTLQGEDHYLEFGDTRTQLLKEVERFLAAHIGDNAGQTQQVSATP